MALGHGAEDEYKKGLSALAEDISGSIGLFFTRLPQDEVIFKSALLTTGFTMEPRLEVFRQDATSSCTILYVYASIGPFLMRLPHHTMR